jgi:abortive infection bacteriophage resistance protein
MVKQPTTFEQQLSLLKQRGCIVENDDAALKVLSDINYYRLSAYFLPFMKGDEYVEGTSFTKVFAIYEFDRKL